MTDFKVSGLTALGSPASDDLLLVVDVHDTVTPPAGPAGSDKKATIQAVTQAGAGLVNLGDTMYGGASGVPTALAGNITATKKFKTQTGTGSVSAAPAWSTIVAGDLPGATTSVQGAVVLDGTAGDIQPLGASANAGATGKAADAGHVHPNTSGVVASLAAADSSVTVSGAGTLTVSSVAAQLVQRTICV